VLDDIDIIMGTFSKSLASVGGFVASTTEVIDYLKHTSRPFVFSASLPPASVAAVGAALDVMRKEPERQQRLLHIATRLRQELRLRGFPVLDGETAIVPVVVQNEIDLCRLCKALLEEGIYINPVLRPRRRRICCAFRVRRRIPNATSSGWWIPSSACRSGWISSFRRQLTIEARSIQGALSVLRAKVPLFYRPCSATGPLPGVSA
jgi:hypothetical protein